MVVILIVCLIICIVAIITQQYLFTKRSTTIEKILNYSFDPIDWDYQKLTEKEKELISEKEFDELLIQYCKKI